MVSEWFALAAAAITALAGVAGAVVSQALTIRARRADAEREAARRSWEDRRDAYLRLVAAVDRAKSAADGALVSRGRVPREVADELNGAASHAELVAPPAVWARIEPAVRAVSAQGNYAVGHDPDRILAEIRKLGADTEEGWVALRREMLAAARGDLGR